MNVSERQPAPATMLAWLQSERVVLPSGEVRSWDNPAHPGYVYPEAAGLLLRLLAREKPASALGNRIAEALEAQTDSLGGVGRAGVLYAFDTAMVLAGVLAHEAAGGKLPAPDLASRLFSFLAERIERHAAIDGDPSGPHDHWSVSFGPHLLKTAIAIETHGARTSDPRARRLVELLLDHCLGMSRDGRFPTHATSSNTYLHAHCYALEGLLWLRDRGWKELDVAVRAGAAWLGRVQTEKGGLPAWHDGTNAWGELHADVAAQAIRIWIAVDRRAHVAHIQRALGFLATLQTAEGGVRYHPASADVNTWCTVFALQACRWAVGEADVRHLV